MKATIAWLESQYFKRKDLKELYCNPNVLKALEMAFKAGQQSILDRINAENLLKNEQIHNTKP